MIDWGKVDRPAEQIYPEGCDKLSCASCGCMKAERVASMPLTATFQSCSWNLNAIKINVDN